MSNATIARTITSNEKKASDTMQTLVMAMVAECYNTFDGDDIPKDQQDDILTRVAKDSTWGDTDAEGARKSEWRACLIAYPYYFAEACKLFRKEHGELRRAHMLKIARAVVKHESYREAVTTVVKSLAAKGKGRKATLGMGLGIIKNLQTRSSHVFAGS